MYAKGEIVWSKIKGFPWWPAVIAKINEIKDQNSNENIITWVLVNFIGDNSHAQLNLDKVSKFWEGYPLYGNNVKLKKLLESIEIAKKILKGETTYENERDKISVLKKIKKKRRYSSSELSDGSLDPSDFENQIQSNMKKKIKIEEISITKLPTQNILLNKNFPSQNSSTTINSMKDREKLKSTKTKRKLFQINQHKNDQNLNLYKEIAKESESYQIFSEKYDFKEDLSNKNTDINALKNNLTKDSRESSDFRIQRKKHPKILQLNSDEEENTYQIKIEKEENENPIKKEDKKKHASSFVVCELEELFKKSLEKILIFSKQNESQEPLMNQITNLLKESSNIFEKILKKSSDDDSIILETLQNDIGKYMQMILRLLEENNDFIKGIFFLDSSIKQLKDMIFKLKTTVFTKFFDYKKSFQNLTINLDSESKILENVFKISIEESLDFPLDKLRSVQEKENQDDKFSSFEEFSMCSDSLKLQKLGKNYEFELETINSEHNSKCAILNEKKTRNLKKSKSLSENMIQEIRNQKLRKKVCLKMYQILQNSYGVDKEKAHKIILNLEGKIRNLHPNMKGEYKNYSIGIMRILKKKIIPIEQIRSFDDKFFTLEELGKYFVIMKDQDQH